MQIGRISIVFAMVLVAGCSLFSSDEEEEVLTPQEQIALSPVPIQAVREIEIGRTRDGFVITAFGTAPALGYSQPQLRARRDGQPGLDGFLDYDFIARPPRPGLELSQGTLSARSIRADTLLKRADLNGAAGIRVHALSGGVQMGF